MLKLSEDCTKCTPSCSTLLGGAAAYAVQLTSEPIKKRGNMASVLKKVCLNLLVFVMMMFGGMLALLGILIVILMHPLTAFKKITRNGGCMWHNNYMQKWYRLRKI